jgi:L-asparaginase II
MTTSTRTYQCFCCNHAPFNSPTELALHISSQKKGHRKSKMWAAKVLAGSTLRNKVEFKPVSKDPDKVATELGDENRANAKLQLSGKLHGVMCHCPHCRQPHKEMLEVEFLRLEHLWLIENKPAVLCGNCKR